MWMQGNMASRWIFAILFLCLWRTYSTLDIFTNVTEPKTIRELEDKIKMVVKSAAEWVFPLALRVTTESNISTGCSLSLLRFFTDFKILNEWALRMLDASAKPPAGVLQGTLTVFGDYDECLDIVVRNARRRTLFKGKYCMVELRLPESILQELGGLNTTDHLPPFWRTLDEFIGFSRELAFRLGICVPSTCTAQEVNQVTRIATRAFGLISNVTCETKAKMEANTEQIVFLSIFAILGCLVIVGTGLDLINQHTSVKIKSGELNKLLIAFSFYSNTVRLFRTVQYDSTLSAIRGCRVLMAFWIILGHTYFFPHVLHFLKYRRLIGLSEFVGELMFKTITNSTVAIDTFFVLSGTLFVYTTWRKLEENKGWINPITYFPLRMARILPIETLAIALFMILPLFGNGPIWNETFKKSYDNCKYNWWTNLLFVQNFWPLEEICLFHTWFIGTLFQLFLLTFMVLLVLYRWPKIGISINIVLILTGCFVTGFLTSFYNLPSSFSFLDEDVDVLRKYFDVIYSRPYTYLCSYCMGILLGYVIVIKRHPKIKPWIQLLAWSLAICGALGVLYSAYFLENKEYRVAYASLHRIIWSFSVCWTLFACLTGYGGIIGRFLSWKGMIPLDRIIFLAYLLHPLVMFYYTARTRAVIYMAHVEQVYIYLATIVITMFLSYVFNVTFEQPLKYIESFFIRKFSKNPLPDITRPAITLPVKYKPTPLPEITITPPEAIPEENDTSKL